MTKSMKIPHLSSLLRHSFAIAAVLALTHSAGLAQAPATPGAATTPPATGTAEKPKVMSMPDKKFVKDTAKSFFYEMKLAEAAKGGATSEATKKFAELVNKELLKGWEPLGEIAKANGEILPTELTGGDKSALERLKKIKGDGFDKLFFREILKEAKGIERDFKTAAKSATDPAIKSFATNYLAIVEGHLTEGEKAEKESTKK